jgi:cytochrome c oxidase subunit IV
MIHTRWLASALHVQLITAFIIQHPLARRLSLVLAVTLPPLLPASFHTLVQQRSNHVQTAAAVCGHGGI